MSGKTCATCGVLTNHVIARWDGTRYIYICIDCAPKKKRRADPRQKYMPWDGDGALDVDAHGGEAA